MTRAGDQRIMAEWCSSWKPRTIEDGSQEYFIDDQVYVELECDTKEQAARIAEERDIAGEGFVLIEEYRHVDYGLHDWEEIERIPTYEILRTNVELFQ